MKNYYKKTVLISGSTGFVGSNIINLLGDRYNFIKLNRQDLNSLIKNKSFNTKAINIDAIIHCASAVSVPYSYENPYYFYNFNINSSLSLANFCLENKIDKFLYLNTYGYGNQFTNPINENAKILPHSPYSKSKYLAEKLIFDYLSNSIEIISLRIFNLYGYLQPKSFLIPNMIEQALKNNVITINNSVTKRDYVYIDDLVDLIEKSIEAKKISGVFNVGIGISHDAEYIKICLSEHLNKTLSLKSLEIHRPNEVLNCYADNQKAVKELNWQIKYNLRDGLLDLLKKMNILNNIC